MIFFAHEVQTSPYGKNTTVRDIRLFIILNENLLNQSWDLHHNLGWPWIYTPWIIRWDEFSRAGILNIPLISIQMISYLQLSRFKRRGQNIYFVTPFPQAMMHLSFNYIFTTLPVCLLAIFNYPPNTVTNLNGFSVSHAEVVHATLISSAVLRWVLFIVSIVHFTDHNLVINTNWQKEGVLKCCNKNGTFVGGGTGHKETQTFQ